ncbi:hypothetical protein RISK_006331 [Rhodopirellula islandica]|uniref:PD(D/E)XK endonuclease domain-containing protein n=1 Tax=Rhodopirellula islandica TaxID=595434 RepID=A0A0J1B434_RHOIS|nr:hypothetical protein RISK_006331 [Rhodopirellula islandica]
MPVRKTTILAATHQTLKNIAVESLIASWLMHDGWQVFRPMLDHAHKTDLLISDGPHFHRIQVKTFEKKKGQEFTNCWSPCPVDYVVFMVRNGNWGVITPGFTEKRRPIDHKEHRKFEKKKRDFLCAFHQI